MNILVKVVALVCPFLIFEIAPSSFIAMSELKEHE
jgi:hypothetical protein